MENFVDPILEELEGFTVDAQVELFTVDATLIGGGVYYFTPSPVPASDGSSIAPSFGGNTYTVIPFESDGWDFSAGGPLPQPTVKFLLAREDGDSVSAASFLLAELEALNDMLGARVLRVRTLRKHLDDGDDPSPDAHLGVDVYTVSQKINQNPNFVEFKLTAALDLEDMVVPKRQVLNHCAWVYRVARPDGSFDYSRVEDCPYVGTNYFDDLGNAVTDPRDDVCGKKVRDCKLRFGENAVLPYGGFPAAGKLTRG